MGSTSALKSRSTLVLALLLTVSGLNAPLFALLNRDTLLPANRLHTEQLSDRTFAMLGDE